MHYYLSPTKNRSLKPLLAISLPVMAANGLETVYNMTDTWFLGRLGPSEVAAPSVSLNLIMLLIQVGMGLSMAGTTLIARSIGQKKQERANFYLGQMSSIMLCTSLLVGVLGFFFSESLLILMGTPLEILHLCNDYLRIICLGIPFMFTFFTLQAAMQGVGNTMLSLKIQLIATAVNIPLDGLLIFGGAFIPALGVKGAAIATISSRAIASIIGFIILFRGKQGIQLKFQHMSLQKSSFVTFMKLGLPASLSQSASSIGFIIMQSFINSFGTIIIAAFGVVSRIHSLFYMPAFGIARGVTTQVGQALGAEKPEEAKESVYTGVVIALLYMIPGMIATSLMGSHFIYLFINDPEVIQAGDIMFKIVSPSVAIFSSFMILTGAFQGSGDVRAIMMMHIGRLWFIRLPLSWVFTASWGLSMGPEGIYWAMFISNFTITIVGFIRFKSGKWETALCGEL